MKDYLLVLHKLVPMYTAVTVQVDDGVNDAAALESAMDEARAIGPVRIEPKVGAWSLRCPAEATGYPVPIERGPEVILMRLVAGESEVFDVRESAKSGGYTRDPAVGFHFVRGRGECASIQQSFAFLDAVTK